MIDCIILVGGLGKRLRSVLSDKPKPLAEINGFPFLHLLLQQLSLFRKIKKVILAVSYLKNEIIQQYKNHTYPYEIIFSEEDSPLGTGGAIQKALEKTSCAPVLVMNGDSYLEFDLSPFLEHHRQSQAELSLIYRKASDVSRYGTLRIDSSQRIIAFEEKKSHSAPGFINSGIYLFNPSLLNSLSLGPTYSLEMDAFPLLLKKEFFGYPCEGVFIDIGTPESLLQAQTLLKPLTEQL